MDLYIVNVASNLFIVTSVLFMDVNCGITVVTIVRIFLLPGRKRSDEYSIYHIIPTDTSYLSLSDHHIHESILAIDLTISLDAMISSDNKIIELLVYNFHFSNTPLSLKKVLAMLLSSLTVQCTNWSVPQFQKDLFECMIYDVWVTWSWNLMVMTLYSVWISTFLCSTILHE